MLLFAPVVLFTPPRLQVLIAAVFGGIVLLYPMLRGADLVPTDSIHQAALSFNEQRAQSLKFRLDNEDMLLARANEKPLAGWGSWGRNRVYDPETGADLSVTDGIWVITIGSFGWLGYLAQFGMLTAPMILLARRRGMALAPVTAGLAVVAAVALIDLIPNATLTPVTWIVAGALAGQAVLHTAFSAETTTASTDPHSRWVLADANSPLSTVGASHTPLVPPRPAKNPHRHRRVPRL
jgi:hypothetical protein